MTPESRTQTAGRSFVLLQHVSVVYVASPLSPVPISQLRKLLRRTNPTPPESRGIEGCVLFRGTVRVASQSARALQEKIRVRPAGCKRMTGPSFSGSFSIASSSRSSGSPVFTWGTRVQIPLGRPVSLWPVRLGAGWLFLKEQTRVRFPHGLPLSLCVRSTIANTPSCQGGDRGAIPRARSTGPWCNRSTAAF